MNSTIDEDRLIDVTDGPEGSGGWEVNEDLWVNVTGDENGIYLSESDPPVPWYRPVLRIIERFNTRDNIILGSGKLIETSFKVDGRTKSK